MNAAWQGNRGLVELLVSMGADVKIARKDGRTAIDLARMGKHQEIVTLLAARSPAGKDQKH
jgi:ankyrin repeat protein